MLSSMMWKELSQGFVLIHQEYDEYLDMYYDSFACWVTH